MKKQRLSGIILFSIILTLGIIYYIVAQRWVRVQILTEDQSVTFFAEKALTQEQRQQGLMFRKSLGENKGMLFYFEKPEVIYMWMKNTLIPLDMIFIHDNKVVSVYENAKPEDLHIISSFFPASHVLEVNAGIAKKYKIRSGDEVRF